LKDGPQANIFFVSKISHELIVAAKRLDAAVRALKFSAPVTHVYNPLAYAWPAHEAYLRRFGSSRKRVVFLGMNPGPFGMVQTGIPFGQIAAVRGWLKIDQRVGRPARVHPRRQDAQDDPGDRLDRP
jgi:single-strand selective monofunctional uracil DNA glycosylase